MRFFAVICIAVALSPAAFAQTRGVFVTPIPNAPLLAVVNTQSSRILPDGTTSNQKTLSAIARDRQGRIFNERARLSSIGNGHASDPIHPYYDPQTRTSTVIDPQQRVAWQSTLNRPPSAVPPLAAGCAASPYVKEEDLGNRKMEGVEVHGIRNTQTIPAEANGGKEIKVVDEYWYSEDLRLNMRVIHKDPRTGEQTTTVTQVDRSEPDPEIFEIPSGYKILPRESLQQ